MTAITPFPISLTMSSVEISELVGSRHGNVLKSIERLAERQVIRLPAVQFVERINNLGGRVRDKRYVFSGESGKRDSIVVVAQLSPEFTGKLVDRWRELEQGLAQPLPPAPPPIPDAILIGDDPRVDAARISPLMLHVAKAFGFEDNQAKLSADNAVRNITGVSPLELMGQKALIAPSKDQLLTVSDIAKRIGVGPMKVNPLLIEMGLQVAHRDHKNRIYYEITEKGETHAEVLDTGKRSNSGTPIKQIKWKTSVLDLLTNHLETTRHA